MSAFKGRKSRRILFGLAGLAIVAVAGAMMAPAAPTSVPVVATTAGQRDVPEDGPLSSMVRSAQPPSPSPDHPTSAQAVPPKFFDVAPKKFITVTPAWTVAFFSIAFVVVGLAWWLGGRSAKDRINALKERIKLARHQCNDVEVRVSDLKDQVAIQKELISELSSSDPTSKRVKELALGNAKIQNALINLSISTHHLSNKLIIVRLLWPRNKRRFVLGNTLIIMRPVRRRKRSSYRYGSHFR